MQSRFLFILLSAVWFAETARAEAHVPATPVASASTCLSAEAQAEVGAESLVRIVFKNRCDLPRSFSWCAENARERVPAEIGCAPGGPSGEPRYVILVRKDFLWRLPAGSRIRFQDCPEREVPISGGCAASAPAPRR